MGIKKYYCICMIILLSLLPGCSMADWGDGSPHQNTEGPATFGLKPDFDYEVPKSRANILVSQAGYEMKSKKTAVFRGENLPENFEIVDAVSGQIVFTGKIEGEGYNEQLKEYNSYGEFDEFSEEGTYYIRAAKIGRSYCFGIDADVFDPVFKEALRQYYYNRCGMTLVSSLAGEAAHSACHTKAGALREDGSKVMDVSGGWHMDENAGKNVIKGSQVIANLLLAYELYPSAFGDMSGIPESGNGIPDVLDEVKYEIDWLLKMQDRISGGVYSEALLLGSDPVRQEIVIEPVTLESTAAFSAIMAKFSYYYQNHDEAFATECLRAADRAWIFLEKGRNGQEIEQRFFAAAELYRATGYQKFKMAAEEYLIEGETLDLMDDHVLWGCVTYISTKQKVNLEICEDVMKQLMKLSEEISEYARTSHYFTAGNLAQDNNDELLHRMIRLSVVDHIISNHEYETVIENHFYYLAGRNPLGISYLNNIGDNNYEKSDESLGIMNRFDLNAELIVMLSEILALNE